LRTQAQLNDTPIASIKISLDYSVRHGTAEINSLFLVMAPFLKLFCTTFVYVLFNAFCSQSAKQCRKSAHNVT